MAKQRPAKPVAIVTGGLSGIGAACVTALEAQGVSVAAGSRNKERHFGTLDVTDQGSIDAFVFNVVEQLGPPTILVNAAGIYREAFLHEHSDTDWQDQIDAMLTGPFRMTRACLPFMRHAQWGRIVNIASTAAHTAWPGYAAYCAAKAGLLGLTRATAQEGAPYGISAVSVSPTWVETPMMASSVERSRKSEAEVKAKIASHNPQGRLVQPQEIAAVVAFCCSDAAPALTYEDIKVNAGAEW